MRRLWRWFADHIERRWYGWAEYYRRRGAKIGSCPVFSSPLLAEPHLCEIGDNVWITREVILLNHDGGIAMLHRAGRTPAVNVVGKIVIHDNVFVGARSILMSDIEVGPNSIIASGSVVTKDVPPNTVVGGCPARVICTVDEYLSKYTNEHCMLWAESEQEIRETVTRHFMRDGRRGKFCLRLRSGATALTRSAGR